MSDSTQISPLRKLYDSLNRHGLALGLVASVFTGFFFWWITWEKRELSFCLRSNRTIIYDSANPLGFDLVMNYPVDVPNVITATPEIRKKSIDENVYSAQILVWNSGNVSVKPEHILLPINLFIEDEEMLDARVTNSSRNDITQIKCSFEDNRKSSNDTDKPEIGSAYRLDWKILEPGDFAVLQIVYAGDEHAPFKVEGVIEGQYPIRPVQDMHRPSMLSYIFIPVAIVFTILCLLVIWVEFFDSEKSDLRNSKLPWYKRPNTLAVSLFCMFVCGGAVIAIIGQIMGAPPADF